MDRKKLFYKRQKKTDEIAILVKKSIQEFPKSKKLVLIFAGLKNNVANHY